MTLLVKGHAAFHDFPSWFWRPDYLWGYFSHTLVYAVSTLEYYGSKLGGRTLRRQSFSPWNRRLLRMNCELFQRSWRWIMFSSMQNQLVWHGHFYCWFQNQIQGASERTQWTCRGLLGHPHRWASSCRAFFKNFRCSLQLMHSTPSQTQRTRPSRIKKHISGQRSWLFLGAKEKYTKYIKHVTCVA